MVRAALGNLVWRPSGKRATSGRLVLVAWLATTAALVILLFMAAVDTAASRWFSAADAESVSPSAVVIADPDLGNSVVYGSIQWRLLQTRLVPRSYDDPFSKPVIIIETTATNLSPEVPVRAHGRDMALVLENGERVPIQRFEHTPSTERVVLEPGQSLPVTMVFKPVVRHDPYIDHLVLEIQEPNRYPAHLNLDGSPGSDLYPRELNVAPSSDAITISDAYLDVNAAAYRARVDERLVVLQVTVDGAALADNAAAGPIWPANEYWRLNVAGDSVEGDVPRPQAVGPTRMTVLDRQSLASDGAPAFGDADSDLTVLEFVFVIPADATSHPMALTAGHADAKVGVVGTGSVEDRPVVPGWPW